MFVCVCVCKCVYVCVFEYCIYVHTYLGRNTYIHTCTYKYTYIQTFGNVCRARSSTMDLPGFEAIAAFLAQVAIGRGAAAAATCSGLFGFAAAIGCIWMFSTPTILCVSMFVNSKNIGVCVCVYVCVCFCMWQQDWWKLLVSLQNTLALSLSHTHTRTHTHQSCG